MQILSYNPSDNEYFLGLSLKEFKEINEKYNISNTYTFNFKEINRQRMEEQKELFFEMYDSDELPFICLVVDNTLSKFYTEAFSFPFHQLWNGYTPWKKIQIENINDLAELKNKILKITE